MHALHPFIVALLTQVISVSADVPSSDINFVTRLVNDAKSNAKDYLNFIQTAKESIPAEFTSLARVVQTYSDDSYTTLIEADNINVSELESFATELPWYNQRIADTAADSGSGSGSVSGSASASASSGSGSSKSDSSSSKSDSSSSTKAASSSGLGASMVVPAGATLAGIIVALL